MKKTELKKILLVEDDPLIVEIYTTKLKEVGFKTKSAPDGESALLKLKEEDFDLLLLDIVLPHMTGFELLKRIKGNKDLKKPKILVLSNLGQKSDVERAIALGVSHYLIKANYTPSQVVEEIKKIF